MKSSVCLALQDELVEILQIVGTEVQEAHNQICGHIDPAEKLLSSDQHALHFN